MPKEFRSDVEIYGTPRRYRGGALHDMVDQDQLTDVSTLPSAAVLDGTEKIAMQQGAGMVQMNTRDLLTSPTDYRFGQQQTRQAGFSDFNNVSTSASDNWPLGEDFLQAVGGTGATSTLVNGAGELLAGHAIFGVISLSTGTTSTGRISVGCAQGGFSPTVWDMTKVYKMLARIRIPVLSDGTNTFKVAVGLLDNNAGFPTGGAWIEAGAGANWRCKSVGTTTGDLDSGIAVATTYVNIGIVYDGAIIHYYLSTLTNPMTEVAQTTSNLPTAGAQCLPGVSVVKSLGATARTINLDYLAYNVAQTTPRGLTLRI